MRFPILLLVTVLWTSDTIAQVAFDKLTQCEDITRLYEQLRAHAVGDSCRDPQEALERTLKERLNPQDEDILCFLPRPPAPFLARFRCLSSRNKESDSLLCIAPSSAREVTNPVLRDDESYQTRAAAYVKAAAKCPASNGDAALGAPYTIAPPFLMYVARYEFGFILSLGEGKKTASSVVHGFATVDPQIPGVSTGAVEFIYMLVGGMAGPPLREGQAEGEIGVFKVTTDKSDQEARVVKELMRRRGVASAFFEQRDYAITADPDEETDTDPQQKTRWLESWRDAVIEALQKEHFDRVSEQLIRSETGQSLDALMYDSIAQHVPYGQRDRIQPPVGPPAVMMNRSFSCSRTPNGAMFAMVLAISPIPEEDTDYGSLWFSVYGGGLCDDQVPRVRKFIDRVVDEAYSALTDAIEREKP
jgi:hypothetical protein